MMLDDTSDDLIQRHLEQVATAADLVELDRLVSERPEVADALWEAARLDALLTLHLQGAFSSGTKAVWLDPSGVRWRRILPAVAAVAAVLLVAATFWWSHRGPTWHPVLTGAVEVDGIRATRIVDEAPLRVVGDRPAVIELVDGARAELAVSTAAVFHRSGDRRGQVLELLEGGGRFHVPHRADRPFRVETCNGSVTTAGTDFEVNLWSTEGKGDQDMSFGGMFVLAVAVVAGMVHIEVPGQNVMLPAGSQKVFGAEPQKQKDLGNWLPGGDVLGFTGKGGEPFALERSVPGVQGALELTAEQKQKIAAAMAETIQSEQVRTAMALAKLNPGATQAQKEEARKAVAEARGKLRGLVGQILTDAQKKLIADINAAGEQVRREVSESTQGEQAPDKHDEAAVKRWREQVHQRIDAALKKRIAEMLNPAQKAAFEQAAAAQAAAEKAAVKPKGPDKTKEPDKGKGPDKGKQTDKPKTLEVRK